MQKIKSILKNKNCLITGASRGLGAQLALTFWEEGANLLLVARSTVGLSEVKARLSRRNSQRVNIIASDLSEPSSPGQVMDVANSLFDRLDILVNNAAIQGPIGFIWTNDWDAWEKTLRLNLVAPIALCRLAVPWMAKHGGGKIINLSGGGATGPRVHFAAYATSKAGLVRFSETLSEETRNLCIDVNCVAPGTLKTEMMINILNAGPTTAGEHEYDAALKVHRAGETSLNRASSLCLFLASYASNGITGKLISAIWDPWENFHEHLEDLQKSDIYTLRRIIPKDRGFNWG